MVEEDEMGSDSKQNSYRLLIVEDDEMAGTFMRTLLRREGYEADIAVNGSNALPMLVDTHYDLVLSDINMPFLDGKQLLDVCRKKFKNIPVILITGDPDYRDAVELLKQGAVDYIGKPLDALVLLQKIKDALLQAAERKLSGYEAFEEGPGYLDGHRIIKSLGRGNYGDVYLVEKLGKQYALKEIKLHGDVKKSGRHLDRFKSEFFSMVKLNHPGVLKVFKFHQPEDDTPPYILMEYACNGSLVDYMDAEHNLDEKIEMTKKLFDAVGYLHENNILHRDIKPENILLDTENNPKLADFGMVKFLDDTINKTADGGGTPCYMSPESLAHGKKLSLRSDLFSLGLVVYELFTGKRAIEGDNLEEVYFNIRRAKFAEPKRLNNYLPEWVPLMLSGLLAKKPQNRFKNAREVLDFMQKRNNDQPLSIKEKCSFIINSRRKVWQ